MSDQKSVNGESVILNDGAKALAHYPHARVVNGMIYLSGFSSRRSDNTHRGATKNEDGTFTLDIGEQTAGVLENMKMALEAAGATLDNVVDCTCFLVDMKDYAGFNAVYNKYFPDASKGPTRTTVAVHQLPHPNLLIEIKAVATAPAKST